MRFNFGLSARITFGAMLLLVAGSLLWIDSENSHQRQSYMGERSADLEAALHVEQARLTQSLERLRQDALFLANTPPVAGMVRAETNNGTDPRDKTSYAVWESRLQEIFAAFLRTHPDYYQLRFIGAAGEGRELVRVESRDGAIQVAQRDALQAKGDQDYFRAGLMLTVGRVHLSEFKLNQEWGKIEEPHRPTINAVTTVFDASGRVFGMVVVNKDVRPLFNSSMAGLPRGVQGYIADQRGHFLFHPDDKHAFSFEFGNNENIADDFPSLKPLLESQTTRNELPFHTVDGGVGGYLAAERVFFDVSDPSRFLLLVYHISSGVADRQASAAAWLNIADIVVFMLLVGVVFLLLLRRTFSPLKRITAAAREIAAGNRNVRLREKDGGEVGELTEALNTMLDKLSDNDLVKQENIFRKELIEALPGIFYMIDARGKFLMWNRNLEQVLKCSPEEVAASLALDFFEGEHKLDIENAIRLGFESGEAEIEAELVAKDGSKAFYHFTGRRIQREGKPVLVGLGIDISLQIENLLMTNALLRRNQALMQNSMDGIHVMDTEGRLLEVNDAFCRMLGYTREEARQLNVTDWDVHFTAEELREKFRGFIGQNSQFETVHRRKDGSLVDVEICANGVEIDGKGYLFAASRDITERKKLQTVLQRYKQVIETTVDGFWMTDAGGYLEEVNEAYAKMSGYTTQELVGMHISQLEANEREDDVRAHIEKLMATGYDRFETRHRRKDGRIIDIEVAATFMPESAKFFVFSHNITQRKQVEQALRVAAAVFEAHEAILITDAEANIIRVNSAFTEVTGYAAEEVIGQNPRIMSSGRQDKEFYSAMWKQITESGSWAGEIWDRRKSGEIYPKWMTISAVKNERGETTQYVAIFSDISARKREEDLIRSMAFYDALTQLPNRRLFLERFQTALTASERYNDYGAILFIDLDRFKMLNDTMGHEYGDLLLMELAVRIKSCVREVDTVARLGGDEFVVLLESISSERGEAAYNAGRVAEKVRAALSRPYQLKEHEHYSSPSIGISLFHGVDEAMDVLLKHADVAMYQSKEEGGNKIRFFDADLQQQWNSGALNQRWDISE